MNRHAHSLRRPHALVLWFCATVFGLANTAAADAIDDQVAALQTRWAEVNYQLDGDAQMRAFDELSATAEAAVKTSPQAAPLWIWSGIIKSSYAGAKGGLGALSLAKASKHDLEKAIELDQTALQGSALTSLGTLYFKVPGWPVGFGDKDKARALLAKALTLNPDGIDPNYFYGLFLIEQHEYAQAQVALEKAKKAAPRPGRELADQGRHTEIDAALAQVRKKLD
jgi:tetratricopeptide (TPR) repeat protein